MEDRGMFAAAEEVIATSKAVEKSVLGGSIDPLFEVPLPYWMLKNKPDFEILFAARGKERGLRKWIPLQREPDRFFCGATTINVVGLSDRCSWLAEYNIRVNWKMVVVNNGSEDLTS